MRWVGVLLVAAAVVTGACVLAVRLVGGTTTETGEGCGEPDRLCCVLPAGDPEAEPVTIPERPGVPCIVHFADTDCETCRQVGEVLDALEAQVGDAADVVRVNTEDHPGEGRRWSLRVVPTQIVLDGTGEETARYEGLASEEELLSSLREAGAKLGEAVDEGEDAVALPDSQ